MLESALEIILYLLYVGLSTITMHTGIGPSCGYTAPNRLFLRVDYVF